MTTVHDRFQVCCSYCGFLSSHRTHELALESAKHALARHNQKVEHITVFDLMAHKGKTDLWDVNGKPVRIKEG